MQEQNYANHVKVFPLFHFFALPVLGLNVLWSLYRVWSTHYSLDSFVWVVVSIALLASLFCARLFALAVQDRIIRLEERLRFAELLPDDLKSRIEEFTVNQLVALRFASDSELPTLARRVLNEKLHDRKQIKRMVQRWRSDYCRA
ncbi:MAG TPA: DUF6526 family protein [Candidatus Acidoferrum sp.]|nr:DUF6526 family protein [Candidatus Acidoferrum sp.]